MRDEDKIRTSKGMFEHYCMHPGCKLWGMYGFRSRFGQLWFCHKHKGDAEKSLTSF